MSARRDLADAESVLVPRSGSEFGVGRSGFHDPTPAEV
jgi:hypothetical protein